MDISNELLLNWLEDQGVTDISRLRQPAEDFNPSESLPAEWQKVLSKAESLQAFVLNTWHKQAGLETCAEELVNKLQTVALIDRGQGHSYQLLYVFTDSDALSCFVGGQPETVFPDFIPVAIQKKLAPLYNVHNGFLDLQDGLTGLKPVNEIAVLEPVDNVESSFLNVFEVGSNMMGFDMKATNASAYIIWGADEDVEEVDDFTTELDEWLVSQIEDYDDNAG